MSSKYEGNIACKRQFLILLVLFVVIFVIYQQLLFFLCDCSIDRVFGPTTTTHHVYDAAAQQVVSGAMEGVNGMIKGIHNHGHSSIVFACVCFF